MPVPVPVPVHVLRGLLLVISVPMFSNELVLVLLLVLVGFKRTLRTGRRPPGSHSPRCQQRHHHHHSASAGAVKISDCEQPPSACWSLGGAHSMSPPPQTQTQAWAWVLAYAAARGRPLWRFVRDARRGGICEIGRWLFACACACAFVEEGEVVGTSHRHTEPGDLPTPQ